MDSTIIQLSEWIVFMVIVTALVTYLFTRLKFFRELASGIFTAQNQLAVFFVYGILAIYSTYAGISYSGAIINIRDFSPMMAGLLGGPLPGVLVGLVGGLHRYSIGGITALPCATATILAGVIAGLIHHFKGKTFPNTITAIALAACMELTHMGLILLLAQPHEKAVEIVKTITLPMIAANTLGMLAAALIIKNRVKVMKLK